MQLIPRTQQMAYNWQRQGKSARLVKRRSYCTDELLAGWKFADAHSSWEWMGEALGKGLGQGKYMCRARSRARSTAAKGDVGQGLGPARAAGRLGKGRGEREGGITGEGALGKRDGGQGRILDLDVGGVDHSLIMAQHLHPGAFWWGDQYLLPASSDTLFWHRAHLLRDCVTIVVNPTRPILRPRALTALVAFSLHDCLLARMRVLSHDVLRGSLRASHFVHHTSCITSYPAKPIRRLTYQTP